MLAKATLYEMAEKLRVATCDREPIEPLSTTYPGMTEEDAYAIQMIYCGSQLRDGKRLIGYKVGLTSAEAQKQFKISQPDFGHLFNDMSLVEESELSLSKLIQPKIEGEIAFVIGKDLRGPGLSPTDVLGAIEYATTAMEIIDSRIRDWKITAVDTIADNGSSSLFVLSGKKTRLDNLALPHLGMALSRNGEVAVTGAGAACLGNPLNAVVFLANELARNGRPLLAGEVILSGSLGPMIPLRSGESYTCEIQKLGSVSLRTVGELK
jgi:2-oxopent-4-enoate hydratase